MSEKNEGLTNKETVKEAAEPTELEAALADAAKWKNDFLYLRAEFDNYKKHALKERSDLLKFGSERVVRDLLDVMDNFERALQAKPAVDATAEAMLQTMHQGLELIAKEFKEVMTKHGVQEVPSQGMPFDPTVHEALSSEPSSTVPEGHIARVFKKPYKLYDKLVRVGQVVVAMGVKGDA